jgi:hypothetical protein
MLNVFTSSIGTSFVSPYFGICSNDVVMKRFFNIWPSVEHSPTSIEFSIRRLLILLFPPVGFATFEIYRPLL